MRNRYGSMGGSNIHQCAGDTGDRRDQFSVTSNTHKRVGRMNEPGQRSQTDQETHQHSSLKQDTADAGFELVMAHLEAFLAEWEAQGFGPRLIDHLPDADTAARRLVLIELIKADLEYRHGSDGPVLRLEDYLAEIPELGEPDGVPAELIYEEYHVRKNAGDAVDVADCLARFPNRLADINRVFQLEATSTMSMSGDTLAETFQTGEQIDDFYLMSALGAGAFGSVFLARQISMQRMVALKISSDKGEEAQTLARLDHPHIVRVYDQHRLPDQNLRLLYMQFAPGGTLQSVIKRAKAAPQKTGRLVMQCVAEAVDKTGVLTSDNIALEGGLAEKSWPEVVCQLGCELAEALHYAHGEKTLHRDVKPANVLLDAHGRAKLADFNISFSSEVEDANAAENFGGSLAYMSPEQLDACNVNSATQPTDLEGRSDVYSLGVLLWELCYGQRPFADENITGDWTETVTAMAALRRRGVGHAPVRLTSAVPQQLHAILVQCLQAEPAARYATAQQLAQAFRLCLEPRVAQLRQERLSGWKRWAGLWPTIAFLIAAISPHILGAAFNLFYNDQAIIAELEQQSADEASANVLKQKFLSVVITINLIAFPIGFACCIWFVQPIKRALARRLLTADECRVARRRSFELGRFVTVLGITEWVIAGVAYPAAMHGILGSLDAQWYVHFFASLLICGLLAAAYPFFLTTTLSLRAFVPGLMDDAPLNRDDAAQLSRLSAQSAWSLYLAGGVPAAGIMILLTTQEANDPHLALTLKILSVLGAVGFAFILRLSRSLQSDLDALTAAATTRRTWQ